MTQPGGAGSQNGCGHVAPACPHSLCGCGQPKVAAGGAAVIRCISVGERVVHMVSRADRWDPVTVTCGLKIALVAWAAILTALYLALSR